MLAEDVVPASNPGLIHLPALTTLTLESPHAHPHGLNVHIILPMLHFSRLQELRLRRLNDTIDDALQSLLAGGMASRLLKLEVNDCIIDNIELIVQILQVANNLDSLQIAWLEQGHRVLEALAQKVSETEGCKTDNVATEVLCPHLRCLNFAGCRSMRNNSVLRLVETRYHLNSSCNISDDGTTKDVRQSRR